MTRSLLVCALAVCAAPAFAEGEVTYRARINLEGTGTSASRRSPPAAGPSRWNASPLFVGAADSTYETGGRLRLGAGFTFTGTDREIAARAREVYGRVSVTSWMDVEAGKRLLRWGVGYGFSPTGVLDPPRRATDPTDRLGINEGLVLARADLYAGDTSLTVAAAAPAVWRLAGESSGTLFAARLRTVAAGVELAAIVGAGSLDGPAFGANVTHVVGQRLEWHAEVLAHDTAGGVRQVSAVAGVQYTFAAGMNLVVEYHRNGRGYDDEEWLAITRGERAPGRAPSRRNALFLRAAGASFERAVSPELIVVAGLDDGAVTVVPSVTWTVGRRLQFYARATRLAGPPTSVNALAPWSTSVTAGVSLRF